MSVIALGEVHEVHDVDDPHPQLEKVHNCQVAWHAVGPGLRPDPPAKAHEANTQQISHISYVDTYVCWGNEWGLARCGGAVGV